MQGNIPISKIILPANQYSDFLFFFIGIQMLTLLVPILINYLLEPDQYKTKSKYCVQLHDQSLQWLMKIGPKYPQEFKTLMGQSPELRGKLEVSIKRNQTATAMQKVKGDAMMSMKANMPHYKPTIELKMDFSNFK